jgi:hypothetical protein
VRLSIHFEPVDFFHVARDGICVLCTTTNCGRHVTNANCFTYASKSVAEKPDPTIPFHVAMSPPVNVHRMAHVVVGHNHWR